MSNIKSALHDMGNNEYYPYIDLVFSANTQSPGLLYRLLHNQLVKQGYDGNLHDAIVPSLERMYAEINAEICRDYCDGLKPYYRNRTMIEFRTQLLGSWVDHLLTHQFKALLNPKDAAAFLNTLKNPNASLEDCFNALPTLENQAAKPRFPQASS